MIIAYTLGHTRSYNKSLNDEPDNCFKVGAHLPYEEGDEPYEGGWIFKTPEEAKQFLWSKTFLDVNWGDDIPRPPKDFSIYKVILENDYNDISKEKGSDGVFHLLKTSKFEKYNG